MSADRHRRSQASPISVRLTPEEYSVVEAAAKRERYASISAFVRAKLFSRMDAALPAGTPSGRLSKEERQRLLGQITYRLGQSEVLRNLSDLAAAARVGALPLTSEVVAELLAACKAVAEIRTILLRALGVKSPDDAS